MRLYIRCVAWYLAHVKKAKIPVFFWILLPIFWSLIANAFICCVTASCLWTMWEVNTSVAQWSDFQVVSHRSSVGIRQWRWGLGEKESHRAPVPSLTYVSDFLKSKMLLSFNRATESRTSENRVLSPRCQCLQMEFMAQRLYLGMFWDGLRGKDIWLNSTVSNDHRVNSDYSTMYNTGYTYR